MEYIVVIATLRHETDKRGFIQRVVCKDKREALRVANALASTMTDTSTSVAIRIRTRTGSVVLDEYDIERVVDAYTMREAAE